MYLTSKNKVYEIDAFAESTLGIPAHTLMYNAGKSAAEHIKEIVCEGARVLMLCGSGKNGGEGYVIANELLTSGYDVCVIESACTTRDPSSTLYRDLVIDKVRTCDMAFVDRVRDEIESADVIVDALFGVGFRPQMPEREAYLVRLANETNALRIAVDIPSGVEADSGRVAEVCFKADHTVTMHYIKRGMLIYPGRAHVGKIHICDIGADRGALEADIDFFDRCVDSDMIKSHVTNRPIVSHKGTFGRLLCICGSDEMRGAAALACDGALRMGVGLCELASTKSVADIVCARSPEVIFSVIDSVQAWDESTYDRLMQRAAAADAVVIGCGSTPHENLRRLIEMLLHSEGCPVLIDADGLNCLSGDAEIFKKAKRRIVITPHPKELSRLFCIDMSDILTDAYRIASEISDRYNITVLIKGASSIIASEDGVRYINTTGNSGLAKGGSGDVLSGMIGALLARGEDTGVSAALGAHIHGAAADMLSYTLGECGMLPRDIPIAAAEYLLKL